tara:strand:- start:705 stop:1748 length:1044 start_codon:yes stop_codon:yes gene_type:complete
MFNNKYYKVPLDKFIDNALYNPKKGYYMKKIPFGKEGDFITAPNISKIFSEMIFLWILSYWEKFYKNKKINVVELGAGNGEMMHQLINSSKKFKNFKDNCNFIIFEKSEKLINLQKETLKNLNIKWIKNLDKLANKPTIFLGNEFLDALPVKQYINYNNQWCERYVEKKGKNYNFVNVKCDIKKIEKKINLEISKNQNFLEISFEEINIIKKLSKVIDIKGGCILFIDYAYSNHKMFDTLQAVKDHKKVDLFEEVGRADISHLINIPLIKKIAKKQNLKLIYNTQRNFLINLGILQRAEILSSKKSFLEKANIFYRVNRLIDKKQMGELFKVLYFYKNNNKHKLGFK